MKSYDVLEEVKRLCKEFGFTAGMLKVESQKKVELQLLKNTT